MASWNSFKEMVNTKLLFISVFAAVLLGLSLSIVYIRSALFSLNPIQSHAWFSSSPLPNTESIWMEDSPNISKVSAVGAYSPPWRQKQNIWTKPIWEAPPDDMKMPPRKSFQLTESVVKYRAKNNIIIVTFGNYAFMDFILNWVKHLTDLSIFNLLVGAMDTKLLEALYWKGIPVFDMQSNMDVIDVGWGSLKFHKMGREKVILINDILPFGYELLMCDTDMVWLKNPLPYLDRFPDADILTSSDQLVPTVIDDTLEDWEKVSGAYNVGIFHWRPSNSSKKLAMEWKRMLLADDKIWDQNGFNELMHKHFGPAVEEESGLVYAYDGSLKLGILPASIFCSGHTYFVQAIYQQLRLEPYAVHTTFQYAGTEGKRHRLREAMVFYDQSDYYDSSGGFLSYKTSIPKSLLLDGQHTVQSHFSLINHQLKQIRTALAIASILNRTLVMPPLWCRLDRLWYGHPGILPGTMTRQPFLCPLDHVFEVNTMLKDHPEEEFGPSIGFREYSFFDNPLLPRQVKESWVDVQPCKNKSSACKVSNFSSSSEILKFPRHSNEDMIRTVFSSYKDVKVIHFSDMIDIFAGFTDEVREKKFRNRVKRYLGIWCCVENHVPGHIYYDMYWDEKPDWKPVPPQTHDDDHPPW